MGAPKAPKPPKPSDQEIQSNALSQGINLLNLQQMGYKAVFDKDTGSYTFEQLPQTAEQQAQAAQDQKIQNYINQRLLGGPVDPETENLVNQTYQSATDQGNQNIEQFVRQQAGQRGLDLTGDSPALKEAAQAKGQLESNLQGARASSLLDQGSRQQLFAASLNEFQQGLRQQAFANRQAIGSQSGQMGLGLGDMRMRQYGIGVQGQGQPASNPMNQLIQGTGALGGLAGGLGLAFSSREFKEKLQALKDDEYNQVLQELENTPVYRWQYKPQFGDQRRHIGPVIEEAPAEIVDGRLLNSFDFLGYLLAALKALNAKVKGLENARPV